MGFLHGRLKRYLGLLGRLAQVGFEGLVSCLFFLLFLRPPWVFSLPTPGSRYARL